MATVNTHSTERRHLLDRRSGALRNTQAGPMTPISRLVYGLVGLAGSYVIYLCIRLARKPGQ